MISVLFIVNYIAPFHRTVWPIFTSTHQNEFFTLISTKFAIGILSFGSTWNGAIFAHSHSYHTTYIHTHTWQLPLLLCAIELNVKFSIWKVEKNGRKSVAWTAQRDRIGIQWREKERIQLRKCNITHEHTCNNTHKMGKRVGATKRT